jgi:hypothetical protein
MRPVLVLLSLLVFGRATAAQKKPDKRDPAQAQGQESAEDKATLADFVAVQEWLTQYGEGAIRMQKDGKDDPEALARLDSLCAALARWNTLPAAKKLFEIACIDPVPAGMHSSMDKIDFHRELQPWKTREVARKHVAAMKAPGLQEFLLAELDAKAQDRQRRDARMRIVAVRGGKESEEALKKATQVLPPEERVAAIAVLGQAANARRRSPTCCSSPATPSPTRDRRAQLDREGARPARRRDQAREAGPDAIAATTPVLDKLKTLMLATRSGRCAPRPRVLRVVALPGRDPGADRRLRGRAAAREGAVGRRPAHAQGCSRA